MFAFILCHFFTSKQLHKIFHEILDFRKANNFPISPRLWTVPRQILFWKILTGLGQNPDFLWTAPLFMLQVVCGSTSMLDYTF